MKKKLLYLLVFSPLYLTAQTPAKDSLPKALEAVEVSATRLTLTDVRAPLAVSVLDKRRLQTATQQLSPYEVLGAIPGVFAMNPDNFSQDLRISIRGFGARAAFGIRGIRLFTDGLPEGTPDGQADVDNLDMGIVQQMEVLRGAASGLYGNAAGGVIYMKTENPTADKPIFEGQTVFGSYGFQRYQVKAGQQFGKFLYFLNGSHNITEGYRAWSQMKNTILNGKIAYQFNPQTKLTILANYGTSPLANDAGGLTLQQVKDNPRQAGANNLLFETGESVTQSRIGATFETKIKEKHGIQARIFQTSRHLVNRLAVAANGFGDLKRQYGGVGLSYQLDEKIGTIPYRLKMGLDVENQADTRQRYAYLRVVKDGTTKYNQDKIVLNQLETFKSTGVYLLQEIQPTHKWLVSLGIRYDDLALKVTDNYLTDGDQSGRRNFQKWNPTIGVNYQITQKAALYANYSSTFESPTLNELSNNPDNTGGFNPNLQPQSAQSYEIGAKGKITEGVRFDVAVYQIETKNDVVPYQITGQANKTFFRNAGATTRKGVELGLTITILEGLNAYLTHTFSDFKYKTYSVNTTIFDGKTLPGIPKNNTQVELRYFHPKGFFAMVQGRRVGDVYANDANTSFADTYMVLNARIGHHFSVKRLGIEPFLGINNVTNTAYIANVQINATGDRFFEPATTRYFFGGLKMNIIPKN
jgi:iron complex outermembrane recepter protein